MSDPCGITPGRPTSARVFLCRIVNFYTAFLFCGDCPNCCKSCVFDAKSTFCHTWLLDMFLKNGTINPYSYPPHGRGSRNPVRGEKNQRNGGNQIVQVPKALCQGCRCAACEGDSRAADQQDAGARARRHSHVDAHRRARGACRQKGRHRHGRYRDRQGRRLCIRQYLLQCVRHCAGHCTAAHGQRRDDDGCRHQDRRCADR